MSRRYERYNRRTERHHPPPRTSAQLQLYPGRRFVEHDRGREIASPAIHDLRQEDSNFTLGGAGFALIGHQSKVGDFTDETQIRAVYYPEAEQLLKDITGADRVFVFDHTPRYRVPAQEDYANGHGQPATRVNVCCELTSWSAMPAPRQLHHARYDKHAWPAAGGCRLMCKLRIKDKICFLRGSVRVNR